MTIVATVKTNFPLILTARIDEADLEPFDTLRKRHFPADRNFIRAHVTMFHRLPGEYLDTIRDTLADVAAFTDVFEAEVDGVRHLGAGVAFTILSPELETVRAHLKRSVLHLLTQQDTHGWRPHITVQNKVSKAAADTLYRDLSERFQRRSLRVVGLDLWEYQGGPWRPETSFMFRAAL